MDPSLTSAPIVLTACGGLVSLTRMTVAKSTEFCLSVHQGLRATDPLAIGLLRLMGGCNDLIAAAEWSSEDKELTDDAADNTIRIGRRFL